MKPLMCSALSLQVGRGSDFNLVSPLPPDPLSAKRSGPIVAGHQRHRIGLGHGISSSHHPLEWL